MRTTIAIKCVIVLLVASGATFSAPAQSADVLKSLETLQVVPRAHQWSLVAPELRPALQQAVQLSPEIVERLARGDARQRGIAIFIADQQGDVARLLALAPLLDDHAQTVPYALPVAHVGGYETGPQTVSEYLSTAYLHWLGVDVDGSSKRFARDVGPIEHPDQLVHPWIVRLRRAKAAGQDMSTLKQQIAALPEAVRWAVITLGYENSLYDRAEARTQLAALSETTQTALAQGARLQPTEPLFRLNRGEEYERLVKLYATLNRP